METGKVAKALKHLQKPVVWEKLTRMQKRVLLCKDVVAAVEAEKITAASIYGFLSFKELPRRLNPGELQIRNVRECLPTMIGCQACARGSLLLARVGRVNQFSKMEDDDGCIYLRQEDTAVGLAEEFTIDELREFENAFETTDEYMGNDAFKRYGTYLYNKHYHGDRENSVLIELMQWCIKHKGELPVPNMVWGTTGWLLKE